MFAVDRQNISSLASELKRSEAAAVFRNETPANLVAQVGRVGRWYHSVIMLNNVLVNITSDPSPISHVSYAHIGLTR